MAPKPQPPKISNFIATPSTIPAGQLSTLSATVTGSQPITLTLNGVATSLPTTVTPSATTTYTLKATNSKGSASATTTVTVTSSTAATHFSVTAPSSAVVGKSFSVTVTALDATNHVVTGYTGTVQITSNNGTATLPPNSTLTNGTKSFAVTLNAAGTFTVTATDTITTTITGTSGLISSVAPPVITNFIATPATIALGQSSVLSATVTGATNLTLDGLAVTLPATVSPTATHNYTLIASNIAGSTSSNVTVTVTVSGVTYYVDALAGNDNNAGTSTGAAWKTLLKVAQYQSNFNPGDTILLNRGATWNETFNIDGLNGASGNPITFGAYGSGALPIVDGQSTRNFCLYLNNSNHIVVQDVHLKNALYDGFHLITQNVGNITDIVANRITADHCGRHGIYVEADPTQGLKVDDIVFNACTSTLNQQTGFLVFNTSASTTGVTHNNCLATYNGQGIASHNFSAYYAPHVTWSECEAAFCNIDPGTGLPNAYTTEGIGFAFDDFSSSGTIEYCYSHDNQGYGIAGAHQADGNVVAYNLVTNNLKGGIVVNGETGTSDATLIYNNTVYGNAFDGIAVWTTATNPQIKNNICANNGLYGIMFTATGVTGAVVDTNVLFSNTSGATANVTGATGTITTDPLFVNAGAGDFSLQAGSPARNAGLNLGSTYHFGLDPSTVWPTAVVLADQDTHGAAWEIGAYVYIE